MGGGGWAPGARHAIKLANPRCKIYGVEPKNAPPLTRSFQQGEPCAIETSDIVHTVNVPVDRPFSYGVCTQAVDGIATLSAQATILAMRYSYDSLDLAIELTSTISLSSIIAPLNTYLHGKNIGMLLCASITSQMTFNVPYTKQDACYMEKAA